MGRIVVSLSIPDEMRHLWEAAKQIAAREKTTASKLLLRVFAEFVERYTEEKSWVPSVPTKLEYVSMPAKRAALWIEQLEELIKANPGRIWTWYRAVFRKQTGLRYETIREYFRVLEDLRLIRIIGSRVYHRDTPPRRRQAGISKDINTQSSNSTR